MKKILVLTVAAAASAMSVNADFALNLDLSGKPVRDVRTSRCGPIVGYAGCLMGNDDDTFWFDKNKYETARALKEAGAWHQRMWSSNAWFARRHPNPYKEGTKEYKKYKQSNPDAAFKFWKENGFKIMFTLEAWGGERARKEIYEFVKYIVDNDYKDVVAGFELGNESYFAKPEHMVPLCKNWANIIDDILKLWPKAQMGIPICELFENNPDLTQVRNRMLAAGEIKRDTYFAAGYFNQTSAKMIMELKGHGKLDKISHIIYHAYGAESPYSCSYYGMQRFRNFSEAFPEIKGKKFWLTEIRPRSDEDNRCQRIFREALIMAHYSLMAVMQPDVDGFNHHQIFALSGGLYQSFGKSWAIQWRDHGSEYPDYRSPFNKPRLDVGAMGVMYRIIAEAIKEHPLMFHHGTSKEMDTEDTFFTSARVTDQVYARRRALKEAGNKLDKPLIGSAKRRRDEVAQIEGEVEWVAATTPNRGELCLIMVNTKPVAETITLTVPGKRFAAPTYKTLSCPEKFLDCREVPGEGKPWKAMAWEDTQWGFDVVGMEKYVGMVPASDSIDITIEPHTVQSVTVVLGNMPKPTNKPKNQKK